jgi:hypothetical protein
MLKIKPDPEDGHVDSSFPYREAVGSLLYLATRTCLDISHTVGVMGRPMADPNVADVTAVRRLMCDLAGTLDYGLMIGGTCASRLSSSSDADWVRDRDRKSPTPLYISSVMTLYTGQSRSKLVAHFLQLRLSIWPPRVSRKKCFGYDNFFVISVACKPDRQKSTRITPLPSSRARVILDVQGISISRCALFMT